MSDHPALARLEIPGPLRAPSLVLGAGACVALGVLAFLVCLVFVSPMHAWAALLQGLMVPTLISGGAMCFIAMNSIGGARWTVPLVRVMEGLGSGFLLTLLGVGALLLFGHSLYDWGAADERGSLFHVHDGQKSQWMTTSRVALTSLASIALWLLLRARLNGISQRTQGHAAAASDHARWSVVFLLVFGVSFTLLMWDLLLGLQARFISATWGFYSLVSALQIFLAVLCLVLTWLARGPLHAVVKPHMLKDLGTWTVAWSCIWAYIAYTQYIIIYFANTNEESYFYLMRMQHGYQLGLIGETLLRFPVPFLLLLSQSCRANPKALCWASALILVGAWIDLWWIIMPAIEPNTWHGPLGWPALFVSLGFLGAFALLAVRYWSRHGLLPQSDPRLLSAINAEHLH